MAIKDTPKPGADHKMLVAELKTTMADKPLYKHPDYLLDDINYRKYLDTNIRELLLTHSQLADEYYESSPFTEEQPPAPSHSGQTTTPYPHEIPLPNVSNLEPKYIDRSQKYKIC